MSPAARDRLASRRRVVCSRVLADEAEEEQTGGARARKLREQQRAARRPAAVYQAGVKRRLRGRWFHLVPAHSHQLSIVFVCLGLLVAGLITGGYLSVVWPPLAMRPLVGRPFRLDIPGGIADWVGSQMLALSAGFAILIYQLRRYRGDDYHGRYRMWRPIVVLLLLLSLDAVTHLRAALAATIDATWGQQAVIAGDDVVRLLLLLAGAAIGLPLLAELHRSFSSIACFFGALCMLALPTALRVHIIDVPPELLATWSGAARLTGRALVLASTICYLRMLFREVRGMDAESESIWIRLGAFTRFRKSADNETSTGKRASKRDTNTNETEVDVAPGFFARLFGRGRTEEDNDRDPLTRKRNSRRSEAAEADEDASDDAYEDDSSDESYDEEDDDRTSRRQSNTVSRPQQPSSSPNRPTPGQLAPSTKPIVATTAPTTSKTTTPTAVKSTSESNKTDEEETKRRGWGWFGRRKERDPASEQETTTATAKPNAKEKPPVIKPSQETEKPAEKPVKSGWFRRNRAEDTAPTDTKPKESPAPKPAKVAAKDPANQEEPQPAKRGWFGWGRNKSNEEAPVFEAADKKSAANKGPPSPATKTEPPKSVKPAAASSTSYQDEDDDDDEDGDGDDGDTRMSKAERRRLKKLQRRQGRAA